MVGREQLIHASTLLRDVPLLDSGRAIIQRRTGDQGMDPTEILDE